MTVPTSRTYGWLALGSLTFILYGSLVPFDYHSRTWADVTEAFRWAMTKRLVFESRSDAVANVMLGVPVGFFVLGWTCVDRLAPMREIVLGVVFLPLCMIFSGFVEFLQLYSPTRTCAASDVLMQALGVVIGMAVWIMAGQKLTEQARRIWAGPEIGGAAGRILILYLVLLAFVQALPLDLTLSPKDIYKCFRDRVVYVPFGEFRGDLTDAEFWQRVRARIETFSLFLPVGLLAGCLPGRFWQSRWNIGAVFGLGLLVAAVMEGLQVLVMSRTPSSTDVTVGAAGVVVGWSLALTRMNRAAAMLLGVAWLVLFLVVHWQPFNFASEAGSVGWLPLSPIETNNPLNSLNDLLTKLIMFALLGVVAARAASRHEIAIAVAAGLAASLVVEIGQIWLPTRTTSVTDVLIGGLGAFFGAMTALRARP